MTSSIKLGIFALSAATLLAASSGCEGAISLPDPDDRPPTAEPVPAVLPRLTASQYRNIMVDLFGEAVPRVDLPIDTNPYLFVSIGATTTELSELGAQTYAEAAVVLADWVAGDDTRRNEVLGCAPDNAADPCIAAFIRSFGRRLFRRPLTDTEVETWAQVVSDTARGDVSRGVRMALYGMLQAPDFLYRVELGEPDPTDPTRYRYTSYEMASRLSFVMWDTAPDEALLDAAERGELVDDEDLYRNAARLVESPRARRAVQSFFAQYLDLGRLDGLDRDPDLYPRFSPTLATAAEAEVRLLVDDLVFRRDADVRTLFSTRRTFVNRELAALYGVEADGATEIAFVPVELPADGPRAGLLTSAAFLSMNAHRAVTSPTLRGKYVRERVLCQTVTPPPEDADLSRPDDGSQPKTLREQLEEHTTNPVCASCHQFTDPPGFLFESFDAVGAYRTTDNGLPIDTSGGLDGIDLASARELADLLADDERVPRCIVQQLYRHANGRLDQPGDTAVLAELDQAFAASGWRFVDLLVELAMSQGFRTVAAPEVSQ